MNSVKIKITALLFVFYGCEFLSDSLRVSQKKANFKTIIRSASDDRKSIISLQLSNYVILRNQTFFEKSFILIDYIYKDSLTNYRNLGIELYKFKNKRLQRISNNGKKLIPRFGNLEFVFYTRHFVDSSKQTQQQFKPYIDKMLSENKDTLHIGTVTEFKSKHGELFEKLTKNDSISIQFLEGNELGERITVPVEW